MIGQLFDCEKKASEIIRRNRKQLALVKSRLANLPDRERKRVARVMAGTRLTSPGDDSFQNEMIAAAGASPRNVGKADLPYPSARNNGGSSIPRRSMDAAETKRPCEPF